MKTLTSFGVFVLSALVVFGAVVSPAVASNSELSGEASILSYIHWVVDSGDDVVNYTTISPTPSKDTHTYQLIKDDAETGYPSATITASETPSAGSSIVDKKNTFDLDIVIPANITYCLKVTVSKGISSQVTNEISVSSKDYSGSYTISSKDEGWFGSKTVFFGEQDGLLIQSDSITDEVWITSTEQTTLHIEGERGVTLNQNWGAVKVQVIMQKDP